MSEVVSVFEYDLLGSGKAASVGAKLVPNQYSGKPVSQAHFSFRFQIASSAKLRGNAFNPSRYTT